MFGLFDLLSRHVAITETGRDGFFDAPVESYCSPGYWVSVAARARKRRLSVADLMIPDDRLGYARAIGIETALRQADRYPFGRRNQGARYSPLVVIANRYDVDKANGDVAGCVRHLFPEPEFKPFVADLCSVIGDLHDNVWSHGVSTGISAAQRWRKPYAELGVDCLEFGLADCGMGFLRELQRAGVAQVLGIDSHEKAIAWCIQEGNSSKKDDEDEWVQRLPDDAMGNPIGRDAKIKTTENHHVGIGLFKLTSLVKRYGGQLWLVSGDAMLRIDAHGTTDYVHTAVPWDGVSLACRFTTDHVARGIGAIESDDLNDALLQLLEDRQRGQD